MLKNLLKPQHQPTISQQKMLGLIIGFGLVGAVLFVIASLAMGGQSGIGKFNQPVLDWMIGIRNNGLSAVAWVVATLPHPIVLSGLTTLISFIWIVWKNEVWRPIVLLFGVGIVASLSLIIKSITDNLRPAQILQIAPFETSPSFPSAHVAVLAALLIITIYLVASRSSIKRATLMVFIILATVMAAIMALDRLYLGVHWFTDVIGGLGLAFMGLAFMILVDLIYQLVCRRYQKSSND